MRDVQLMAVQPILEQLVALATARPGGPIADQESMLRLRTELRKLLVSARSELGRHVTEREAYLTLFPLVVNLDEVVQLVVLDSERVGWPMLQKDLYDTDKGGQLFYQALDEILDSRQVSPFLYQVYYFCLRLGFRGQLVGQEDRVQEYLHRLLARFPAVPERTAALLPQETGQIGAVRSPLWYYVPAAAVVIAAYFVIAALAGRDAETLRREPARAGATAALRLEVAPGAVAAISAPAPASQPVPATALAQRDPASADREPRWGDCPPPWRCPDAEVDDDVGRAGTLTARLDDPADDDTVIVDDDDPPPRSGKRSGRAALAAERLRAAVQADDEPSSDLQPAAYVPSAAE
jgi:type IV/VI secretion system ImpK/VasF family protein